MKLCKDCRDFKATEEYVAGFRNGTYGFDVKRVDKCISPRLPVEPVYGNIKHKPALECRAEDVYGCGRDAKWFEEKTNE